MKEKKQLYNRKYSEKRNEILKANAVIYREGNRERINERNNTFMKKKYDDIVKHAIDSIKRREIIDRNKWSSFCYICRMGNKKYPYSDDLTDDVIFEKLKKDCFYCGDNAISLDRLDSNLNHTGDNCVGSCLGCNNSKGTSDPLTFIRKTYYRVEGKYIDDDTDIWFVQKNKPRIDIYKKSAERKKIPFTLIKKDFEKMIIDDCKYCRRSPTTWFGIDRIIPEYGYVIDNVVTCCFDCNIDKFSFTTENTINRNMRIVERLRNGYFDFTDLYIKIPRNILHKGKCPYMKKVCAYGKLYESQSDASRSMKKSDNYVISCIKNNRHSKDIFNVSDKFYEIYKDCEDITLGMFIGFDHYYTTI